MGAAQSAAGAVGGGHGVHQLAAGAPAPGRMVANPANNLLADGRNNRDRAGGLADKVATGRAGPRDVRPHATRLAESNDQPMPNG